MEITTGNVSASFHLLLYNCSNISLLCWSMNCSDIDSIVCTRWDNLLLSKYEDDCVVVFFFSDFPFVLCSCTLHAMLAILCTEPFSLRLGGEKYKYFIHHLSTQWFKRESLLINEKANLKFASIHSDIITCVSSKRKCLPHIYNDLPWQLKSGRYLKGFLSASLSNLHSQGKKRINCLR